MSGGEASELWQPDGNWLVLRAATTDRVREFFRRRSVLEVRTPTLSRFATTAVHLRSIRAGAHWLRTSPEHHMKRLLAAGSGDIWQLGPCFRAGEAGRLHNPEFDMLEWYRTCVSLETMRAETRSLIDAVLGEGEWIEQSYAAFMLAEWELELPCDRAGHVRHVRQKALAEGAPVFEKSAAGGGGDPTPWLDFLLQKKIEADYRTRRLLLHGFPPDQAELAAVGERNGQKEAMRFEIWINGVELANGAEELLDAGEAARRFAADNERRQQQMPVDQWLLEAMRRGLPACCGTALGFDRLLMLLAGERQLPLEFPFERA